MPTPTEIHVTSIRNGVYGHETSHCDAAGCSGTDVYWKRLDVDSVEVGKVYRLEASGEVVDVADEAAVSSAASAFGKKGGSAKSAVKTATARENGAKGGRPVKKADR